jgi:FkbM family methyltransferase
LLATSELLTNPRVLLLAQRLETDIQSFVQASTHSRSQLGQELIALALNEYKPGYFVEFGGTDGLSLSNTAALEKHYGWTGIVAEPSREWHEALRANRGCNLDFRAVHAKTGEHVRFIPGRELGTIKGYESLDYHAKARQGSLGYAVETVSLEDLLNFHSAPSNIDYLSIDTEGSELDVLRAFDFSKYSFGFVSVEHNHAPWSSELHELMASNGYSQVLAQESLFESWFIGPTVRNRLAA